MVPAGTWSILSIFCFLVIIVLGEVAETGGWGLWTAPIKKAKINSVRLYIVLRVCIRACGRHVLT